MLAGGSHSAPPWRPLGTAFVLAVGDDEMFTEGKSRIVPGAKIYFLEEGYINIGEFMLMKSTSVLGVFHKEEK